jgi:NADPH-dependent 2,4-dienoyl-CoA reductase/sulfur reductase-like enzyme
LVCSRCRARSRACFAEGKGEGSGGYHLLVVGAGLSGAVMARESAEQGKKVLVIDKRGHLAGNCYDYVDKESGCVGCRAWGGVCGVDKESGCVG